MAVKISDDEVWYWYQQVVKFQSRGDNLQSKFCQENGLAYKQFTSKYRRIVYLQKANPKLYEKVMPLARKFLDSGMTSTEFSKIHKIALKDLSEACTHIRYLEIIDRLKAEREQKPMEFIQVPTINFPMPTAHPQQEVLKKQNDIELMISAGVKVVVAPEVGADKLVRIIELLKDL